MIKLEWVKEFLKTSLGKVFLIALFSRILIFCVALISNSFTGDMVVEGLWRADTPFFNLFAVWDSAYYMHIATHGYTHDIYWGFFPLYPLLIKCFSLLFTSFLDVGEAIVVGGFLLSNIFFFGLIIYFFKLTLLIFKNKNIAYLSTLFLCIFPSSIFFSAVYTESLFMFLTISSLYYMEKNKWEKSTVLAFLSGLTKPIGFLIFIPLICKAFYKIKRGENKLIVFFPMLILFSYISFMFYGYLSTGDFFIHQGVQSEYWGRNFSNPLSTFMLLQKENQMLVAPFIFLSLLPFLYFSKLSKKINKYYIYAFILLIIYLFSGHIISFPRHALTLIPIFWFMGKISLKDKFIKNILYVFCLTILVIGTAMFVNWYNFY